MRKEKSRRRPTLARAGPALPSAKRRLTSVFGMGTGIAASLWPPAESRRLDLKRTATLRGRSLTLGEVRAFKVPPDLFPEGKKQAKPHDGLVPLGSTHRCAFTRGLSRTWSTSRLEGARGPGRTCLGGGLALRCFQRLSVPGIATGRAAGATARTPWARDSRSSRTRESSPQFSCARRG